MRQLGRPAADTVVQASAVTPHLRTAPPDPAFVEVDSTGAWLYQLTPVSDSRDAIQVAFIVDPHLEL